MDNWISVEDGLPETGAYCIVSRRVADDTWWFGCSEYYEFGFPFVTLNDSNPITHWMPLPEPPE